MSPAPFDPSGSIYQSTPYSSLCRSNLAITSPELKQLIAGWSTSGILARQELGSMLPVLCLRAVGAMGAESRVLDLCASPGSKTLQALEIVAHADNGGFGRMGRVIANDVHPGRLDALRDAVLRSGVPERMTSRVTYTNYDACVFPSPGPVGSSTPSYAMCHAGATVPYARTRTSCPRGRRTCRIRCTACSCGFSSGRFSS